MPTEKICVVLFRVDGIEAPDFTSQPFYEGMERFHQEDLDRTVSMLTVTVSRVLEGDCATGEMRLFTRARTSEKSTTIAGMRRQLICPGDEVVGIVAMESTLYDGHPFLSGSTYFVFGEPNTDDYLGYLADPVLRLYNQRPR